MIVMTRASDGRIIQTTHVETSGQRAWTGMHTRPRTLFCLLLASHLVYQCVCVSLCMCVCVCVLVCPSEQLRALFLLLFSGSQQQKRLE